MRNLPNLSAEKWEDLDTNPVVNHIRDKDNPGDAYGDPQVLLPGQFDNQWHMFFHGFVVNEGQWFHHMLSSDGIHWLLKKRWQTEMGQSFILKYEGKFYFYSSCYQGANSEHFENKRVAIKVFITEDLEQFDGPYTVLEATLPFEIEGPYVQIRNPCAIYLPNGKIRLYYCGGTVMLQDVNYEEPKYISFAEADTPLGPFTKHGEPILSPDPAIPHRTLGSGAIKVFGYEDSYVAFYNGVYQDAEKRSRSAISVLFSIDGVGFEEAPYNPIIIPDVGWRKAIVYQLDLVTWDKQLRMYYNSRSGWLDGIEKIGCSVMPAPMVPIRKLSGY